MPIIFEANLKQVDGETEDVLRLKILHDGRFLVDVCNARFALDDRDARALYEAMTMAKDLPQRDRPEDEPKGNICTSEI